MELSTIGVAQKRTSPNPFCLVGTALEDGITNLAAISWWNYASNHPAMVTVCLSNKGYSGERIRETRRFTIQLLPEEFKEKAFLCGTVSGRDCHKTERFQIAMETNTEGYPDYVKGSVAVLNCRLENQMAAGDHTVYLAEVEEVLAGEIRETLHTFDGYKALGVVK